MDTYVLTVLFVIVIAAAGAEETKSTTEPLFLDTTLVPVVGLSITNKARAQASESTATQDLINVSKEASVSLHTVQYENSQTVEATPTLLGIGLTSYPTPAEEDSTSVSRSGTLQPVTTVESSFQSSSWEVPLTSSFPDDTFTPPTFTEFLPHALHEDASSFPEISRSSTIVDDSATVSNMNSAVSKLGRSFSAPDELVEAATTSELTSENITPSSKFLYEMDPVTLYSSQLPDVNTFTLSPVETEELVSTAVVSEKPNEDHEILANSKRLGFVLKKRCTEDSGHQKTFEKLNQRIESLLNGTLPLYENQSAFVCDRVFHITVSLKNTTDSFIVDTVKNLTGYLSFGEHFRLEKIYLYTGDHTKTVLYSVAAQEENAEHFGEYTLSERELIAYIVAGVSFATLVFILLTFCCVRFLCKKQTTSLDLCDIPHVNLKLEDYKLTPIPRPTISFTEYGRELFNPAYNDHAPKLEDTILNQHHFTSSASTPGNRESMSFPREMRTFGGKKSCSRVQSLDSRPARAANGWMSNSREKLSSDFERRNSGFDNVAFRKCF